MDASSFFYLGLAFLLLHEMDAMRCREWRIFPGLSLMNEKWGFPVFLFAHVPLFFFLLAGLADPARSSSLMYGLNIFFMIHFGLHLLFLRHPNNEFTDWISWTLISGAGLCGFLAWYMG
jgi:hypothetical protein